MHPLQENGNIPAFLVKLWKMVNDPSTDHLICWSQNGNTFIIQNQAQFWYKLLPLYYKHNNMSSFVRQLNMYGFHKITSLVNPVWSTQIEKNEAQAIQFYHPCFQKDKPEKLVEIKRKSTTIKTNEEQAIIRPEELNKVLFEIKQLKGKQSSVDSQLTAMKQENSVLWKEIAILRQKHGKQRQIVNKLIQFLVTLVQPNESPRMGVKRRMPLMLDETPTKRTKSKRFTLQDNDCGPTIHELDSESELSPAEQLLQEASNIEQEDTPLIDSPVTPKPLDTTAGAIPSFINENNVTSIQQQQIQTDKEAVYWDAPEFISIGGTVNDSNNEPTETEEELFLKHTLNENENVFLNPNNQNALIGNLVNLNGKISNGKSMTNQEDSKQVENESAHANMQLAKRCPPVKITNGQDLDDHVDSTQNELEQLKDILNGCNNFDTDLLFRLFGGNDSDYITKNTGENKEKPQEIPGNLVPEVNEGPVSSPLDFTGLFDEEINNDTSPLASSSLNTPVIEKNDPIFPAKL